MKIPNQIKHIIERLKKHGFEAYIVGGCVRDLLMGKIPQDWDITTNAKPEDIQRIFPKNFYDNKFGTVSVITPSKDETLKIVQITPFRQEAKYTDKRHPDQVKFVSRLEDDLARRDFTINAMAIDITDSTLKVIDPFGGQKDNKEKNLRAVGDPAQRFGEDALRMMRAIRFAVTLSFDIESETFKAIKKNSSGLKIISKERIRDELEKIILSEKPNQGIEMLKEAHLLGYIIPELEKGIGITQNRHHIYTIYEHSILSLKYCPSKKLEVRLAALFHDIAKPETKRGAGPDATFYNHDIVGARVAEEILRRLRFPIACIQKVSHLIRNHMFFYNVGEVSEAGVRRLLRRIGYENVKDLIDLRIADRLGSGVPKAKPYKLRHLEYLIEKVRRHPISVAMLKVNGNDIMRILDIKPGPMVGAVLNALLAEVLETPELNTKKELEKRISELGLLNLEELRTKTKIIEEKKEEVELEEKKRFRVK